MFSLFFFSFGFFLVSLDKIQAGKGCKSETLRQIRQCKIYTHITVQSSERFLFLLWITMPAHHRNFMQKIIIHQYIIYP